MEYHQQETTEQIVVNQMKADLWELIEIQENGADVGEAVTVIGLCAAIFQKIIRELEE